MRLAGTSSRRAIVPPGVTATRAARTAFVRENSRWKCPQGHSRVPSTTVPDGRSRVGHRAVRKLRRFAHSPSHTDRSCRVRADRVRAKSGPGASRSHQLNRRCASSRPSRQITSTASAARRTSSSRSSCGSNDDRTKSATSRGSPRSGLPTPTRRRRKSGLPSIWAMERSPLCPASPPPARAWSRPRSRSTSSWTTSTLSVGTLKKPSRSGDRPSGLVHEGLGLEERQPVLVDPCLGEPPVELRLEGGIAAAGELVDDHPADVVAITLVTRSGVAEARDEQIERRGTLASTEETHATPLSRSSRRLRPTRPRQLPHPRAPRPRPRLPPPLPPPLRLPRAPRTRGAPTRLR